MSAPKFRLPPGATPRQRDKNNAEMLEWLAQQLDEQDIRAMRDANRNEDTHRKIIAEMEFMDTPEGRAVLQAHAGNLQPLRELFPQHAEFIFPRPRPRGRPRQHPKFDIVKFTADLARRIRALWVEHHGKKTRYRGEMSAEKFAVEICRSHYFTHEPDLMRRVTVTTVEAALKPSGKHRRRRSKR